MESQFSKGPNTEVIELKFGQYQPVDAEDVKARRKAEEQYRNQRAYSEAQKADLLKKQRKIQECQEQILRMDRYAERCLMEGQEKKAGVYLERKVEWQNRLTVLIEEAGFVVKDAPASKLCEEPCESLGEESYRDVDAAE